MSIENTTIFDADRTLWRGPSTEWGLKSLARAGLLNNHKSMLEELDALHDENPLKYISRTGKVFSELVGTVPEDALTANAELAAEEWEEEIFPEMAEEIDFARERGPFFVLSYGPDAFIRPFARRIGAAAARGRTLEDYKNGTKPHKSLMATIACSEIGITWKAPNVKATVFGDSYDDVPVLEQADTPVLVNPIDEKLEQLGKDQGWEIKKCASLNDYGLFGDLRGRFLDR